MNKLFQQIVFNKRPLIMLVAMISGILLYKPIYAVDNLTHNQLAPLLIFSMLFVTFCKVHMRNLRLTKLQFILLVFQLGASLASYYIFLPLGEIVAQGAMITFLMPIAMGAVAIGALLGANIITLASYSLVCNVAIAFIAPLYLDVFGNGECTLMDILQRVAPLLITPLLAAQLLKRFLPYVAEWIGNRNQLSFYMWLGSMIVTLGRTTTYLVGVRHELDMTLAATLSLVSLFACYVQYGVGGVIGKRFGDRVASSQSLGQKN
ncbi:MAG: transporter, partial [Rikenellaceae bacterium]